MTFGFQFGFLFLHEKHVAIRFVFLRSHVLKSTSFNEFERANVLALLSAKWWGSRPGLPVVSIFILQTLATDNVFFFNLLISSLQIQTRFFCHFNNLEFDDIFDWKTFNKKKYSNIKEKLK
jgi:hypothetical protein